MSNELRRKLQINGEIYHLAVNQYGPGAPTAATPGKPAVLYMDTDTGELYKCTAADVDAGSYTWEPVVSNEPSQNGDGLTSTEKSLILSLFKNAAYTADISTTITQLEMLWSGSGGDDSGGSGEDDSGETEYGVSQVGSVLTISGVADVTTITQSGTVLIMT